MSVDHAVVHRSQRDRVLDVLRDLDWHTYAELSDVGGIRYSARLLELKRMGYRIEDGSWGEDGKRYRLLSVTPGVPLPKRVKVFLTLHDAATLLESERLTRSARQALRAAVESFRANESKL